ncbi:hypothetical protein L596_000470 [Steinernema carpocapsae]|uniref:Uncharacterized protein n=1 Tax=Steinernema carpocapsae TaxID=34508 RepID=A0A4U8UMF9_STECR|nr:hypothetical protein L596_000470 [Steinernema carpocapsae]
MNAKETAKMRMAIQADYPQGTGRHSGIAGRLRRESFTFVLVPELQLDLSDLSDAEATSDEKETAKEDLKSSEPDHKGLGKSDQSDELPENRVDTRTTTCPLVPRV